MRKQRTNYDKTFKENAVKLSLDRNNVSELPHKLGIDPLLLYSWRKEYQQKGEASFPGKGVQSLSEEARRIMELEKRLNESEIELEILKKNIEHQLQERSLICEFIRDYHSKR